MFLFELLALSLGKLVPTNSVSADTEALFLKKGMGRLESHASRTRKRAVFWVCTEATENVQTARQLALLTVMEGARSLARLHSNHQPHHHSLPSPVSSHSPAFGGSAPALASPLEAEHVDVVAAACAGRLMMVSREDMGFP